MFDNFSILQKSVMYDALLGTADESVSYQFSPLERAAIDNLTDILENECPELKDPANSLIKAVPQAESKKMLEVAKKMDGFDKSAFNK